MDKIKKKLRNEILFFVYFPEYYSRRVRKSTNKKILALSIFFQLTRFVRWADKQIDGQTDRRATDGRTDKQADGGTNVRTDIQTDIQTDSQTEGNYFKLSKLTKLTN